MSLSGSNFFYTSLLVLGLIVLQVCQAKDLISSRSAQDNPNSQTSSSPASLVKLSSVSGVIVGTPKDGLSKRDIQVPDLSGASSGAITAKSYDPPPEFYRGPGSTSASAAPSNGATTSTANGYNNNHNNNNNNRDSATAGFVSKPIAFPGIGIGDANGHNKYLANAYNNWQQLNQLKHGSAAGLGGGHGAYNSNNNNHIQDRISVGHYGSAGHNSNPGTSGYAISSSSGGAHSGGGGGSTYVYEGGHHPAYYEGHSAGHYATSGHGGGGGGGGSYYGGSSAEGIPFDVYGTKHAASGAGHYAGAGGEYSYTYPDLHAEPPTHKGHALGGSGGGHGHELSSKALLAKSFLIPLASAAVLGIAAALVSNPLLLQLGTVSGVAAPALIGKRKRRDLAQGSVAAASAGLAKAKKLSMADLDAYRGQRQQRQTRV